MDVSGKAVLLTGGSAGIGQSMARQLRAKGARVTITGRDAQRLNAMRSEGFDALSADLSHASGVEGLLALWGDSELDILINNAGQGVDHDFREAKPDADATDACIYANLSAPIRMTTALMPLLRARPEAAIVNVTSGLAIAPRAGGPVYCATKAGLRSYTQAIRAQLAGTGIHVIEALPPVVDTQMTAGRTSRKMSPEACARQIIDALEHDRAEANVGMVKVLRAVHSVSPSLASKIMLRF